MECYSTVLGNFFAIFKNILKLIQIIGPILMLIALSINLYTMVKDPEDKKTPKKIKNSIIALILLSITNSEELPPSKLAAFIAP